MTIWHIKTHLPVQLAFVFTLRWDGADFFCTTKKLVCFVKKCRETWGNIAWKQIEYEKNGTIYPKKGKAETENVDKMHMPQLSLTSRVGKLGWRRACCPPTRIYMPAYGQ